MIKKIGEGSYAKVYLTDFRRQSHPDGKSQLACKIVDIRKSPREYARKFCLREIAIIVKIKHPYIVHIHSIFVRKFKYYIFMRFAEKGDLLDYVCKEGSCPEAQARIWFRQIALAIQYLHDMGIAHRDLKCENTLITSNFNVKLADFGFARSVVDADGKPIFSETYCGSLLYAAPEVLHGTPYFPKTADVWSLGVILFVMLNKSMPFEEHNPKKLRHHQIAHDWRHRAKIVDTLSDNVKKLVAKLLEPIAHRRIKIGLILTSDWIAMDPRLLSLNEAEKAAHSQAVRARESIIKLTKEKNIKTIQTSETKVLKEASKTVFNSSSAMEFDDL